jgi:CyaY protein
MDERSFVTAAEAELGALDDALAALEPEGVDWQLADGVLTLELDDRSKIVVNVHRPAMEIWVAAGASAWHFHLDAGRWCTYKGEELRSTLARLVGEKIGQDVRL